MTIRRRIALVSATAVAVAVVLVAIGAFVGARRQVMTQIDDSLVARAEFIAEIHPQDLLAIFGVQRPNAPRERVGLRLVGDFDTSYYQVILRNRRVVNIGDDDLVLPEPRAADLEPEHITLRSVWVDGVHLRVATVVRNEGEIIFQIARPLTEADAFLSRMSMLLMVGGVIGVALAAVLGLLVASRAVKPIGDLTRTVGRIAQSQTFSERVDVAGDDEVAELATEFNVLLDELQASREQQVRLVRDAGHELRTPLTALRTNIEVLQRHKMSAKDRNAMLAAAHAEVEELASLVSEVVDLATDRYEEEAFGPVDLAEVVDAVAERYGKRRGRLVDVTSDRSVVVGKRQALERAVSNIVGNADKFSDPDDSITVVVEGGVLTVADKGPGFDKHDLPHVFERFYRSDAARGQPGSGLGLSIVKQIIDDHGGEVFARNRSGGGAEVGFVLKLDESEPSP